MRWRRSRWKWSTSLSTDASGVHLQMQKILQRTAEYGQESLTTRKDHTDSRPSTSQLPVAPSAGRRTQIRSKVRTQTQSSADRLPPDTPKHTLSPAPTRTKAQAPPNTKPTQATRPASLAEGRDQNWEELWPSDCRKGDLTHSKLDKMKRWATLCKCRSEVKTHRTK